MSRKAYSEEERGLIRSRLMDVAAALFKEKGIRDTNIDEIYTPVGISKTFFYSFFPSKAVLAIAIMKEGMGGINEGRHGRDWRPVPQECLGIRG